LFSVWVTNVISNEACSHYEIKLKVKISFGFSWFTSPRVGPSFVTNPAENKPEY
jgi:hypothetical protein